jgi:hypothetical protein
MTDFLTMLVESIGIIANFVFPSPEILGIIICIIFLYIFNRYRISMSVSLGLGFMILLGLNMLFGGVWYSLYILSAVVGFYFVGNIIKGYLGGN